MKPNIIIVMADQQRHDLRKSRGYALNTMPFLDSWAKGGVDFECAYTPNPTCMPARVSMFTGRYPESHKVRTNHNAQDALYTADLMDVLKAQGYRTALCGKNHSHRPDTDFDFHETNGHLGKEGEINTTEAEKAFSEFLCGTHHMETHTPSPGGLEVQYPYRNVSSALKFIDESAGEAPFFTWVSFAEPHNPYQVPAPYFDMFPPEALPKIETSVADLAGKGHKFEWLRDCWEAVLPENIEQRILRARSNYHGMLRLIDDQFKRLVEGVAERGLSDNTVIVYLADHGDFVGEYDLIRKGPALPEVLTHIPMVWRGAGVCAQNGNTACVSLVDILPTVCDILNVESPLGCQGRSLNALLKNEPVPQGEFDVAYAESGFSGLYWNERDGLDLIAEGASRNMVTFDCLNTWTQCGQVRMARKGDYKVQVDMLGKGYLYNIKTDPVEVNNLWDSPDCLAVKAEMLTALMAATLRACDPLPVPHRRYRTKLHPKGYWYDADYISKDPGVRKTEGLSAYCGWRRA